MEQQQTFSIDELATLSDLPRRTLRYYIQMELVDRPVGGRKSAYYTQRHLEQLLEIRKWQKAGLSLGRIKELLCETGDDALPVPPRADRPGDVTVRSHVTIMPGIELVIDPGTADMSPEQVRELVRQVLELSAGKTEIQK